MGIERVRKELMESTKKKSQVIGAEMELEKVIDSNFEMAEGFFKKSNYPAAYFMYFKCLKNIALLHIKKKIGESNISKTDAVSIVLEKKLLPLTKKDFKDFEAGFRMVLNRRKLKRDDCLKIRKSVRKLKK